MPAMADETLFQLLHTQVVAAAYGAGRGSGDEGTYILQDNNFPFLTQMAWGQQYLEEAPKFLAFTCGLLRGTLSSLGIESSVTASVTSLPACKFQVVIQKA
uniref:Trafficking protein particle complex subunit 6A n=1 Tax=Sarcophilus harrisii TaxID=9305 RepID=A0A7N4PK11_SARHA